MSLRDFCLYFDSSQWFDFQSPFHFDRSDILGSNTNSWPTIIFIIMAAPPFPDTDMQGTHREMLTSEIYQDHPAIGEDPSSVSYIPRTARTVPQALTVHTIYMKKITYPMTSRQPELWILERTQDGLETWRPVETFLGNLQLSQDPRVLRAIANQWRLHYTVLHPVLPHPEHSNVHFGQPVLVIPDHAYILQSCWGRSAQHHSQGAPTSLYCPPWRTTPPSSQTTPTPHAPTPASFSAEPPRSDLNNPADMSDSSV